jgi:hypothetical protein
MSKHVSSASRIADMALGSRDPVPCRRKPGAQPGHPIRHFLATEGPRGVPGPGCPLSQKSVIWLSLENSLDTTPNEEVGGHIAVVLMQGVRPSASNPSPASSSECRYIGLDDRCITKLNQHHIENPPVFESLQLSAAFANQPVPRKNVYDVKNDLKTPMNPSRRPLIQRVDELI